MPYADGYDNGCAVFDRKKGFIQKPVQVRTEISIKTIDHNFIKKHNIQVGEVMPWSGLKITGKEVS